jgi:phosphoribosylglycinamide formyltransferase-1
MTGRGLPPLRTAILVSGNGSNLQAIIDQAHAGELNIDIVGVISDRPEAYALARARAADIPAFTVHYTREAARESLDRSLGGELARLAPDLVALAGFMRILPADLVDRYRGRMLNVHPSLLPKYPGLDTYRRVLQARDAWHGSTVHFVIPALDSGPPIIQYRLRVRTGDTDESLRRRVQSGEHLIYPAAIRLIADRRVEYRDGRVWRDGAVATEPLMVDEAEARDCPPAG